MIAEARREQIREMLMEAGAVTVSQLQARFGVSPMTARRDLVALERARQRTPHARRRRAAVDRGARELVHAAASARRPRPSCGSPTRRSRCCEPGETIFLDSSSTAYFLARRIADSGLAVRVLTNSGPVDAGPGRLRATRTSSSTMIGGTHRRLTGSFVGPSAVRMIREHFVDRLFLSVTGIARQRHADRRRRAGSRGQAGDARAGRAKSALLLDASKLATHGRHAVAPVTRVSLILAEVDDERMHADGVTVRVV